MNIHSPPRGRHLLRAPGLTTSVKARLFSKVLDRLDRGIAIGLIEITLPDGTLRMVGGRGAGPVAQLSINRWRALLRLASSGSVGGYQGWTAADWTSDDLVTLFELFMRNRVTLGRTARAKGPARWVKRLRHALRRNDRSGSKRNIHAHYDLGNDFYTAWLDASMTYSCALFEVGDTLETAQARKIDALLDRLDLKRGETVLEIGCGWGSLAAAAQARCADVTAISLSANQLAYARAHTPDVTFLACDYRDVTGQYDAIASVEMVEAVGHRYWPDFLDTLDKCLKPGGRVAFQYIAIDDAIFDAYTQSADFIQTYIFPGGMLLSESRFRTLAEARGFTWSDPVDLSPHYAQTLGIWRQRFDQALEEGRLPPPFDARFVRLWQFYLMYCEGGFRGGGLTVGQVTLVRP